MAHPNITCFLKSDMDNSIPHYFWIDHLPNLTRLRVLDLKLICTDEILETIGQNCLNLEEINAVSRVDLRKSPFNASVLIRNVSDAGLNHLLNLKHLRILAIDPPRNERLSVRVGRCISQAGIRRIVSQLPALEELRVESCDIGSTLVAGDHEYGPLTLKKINCHFVYLDSVQKLLTLCPCLRDLSLTHLSGINNEEILQQVAQSDVRLYRLDLSFFGFSDNMQELLKIKGSHITNFSLLETDTSLSFESILTVGKYCPNIVKFRLITQSKRLIVPANFKSKSGPIFSELKSLTLGCDNFVIENILVFFLTHAQCLSRLSVKYQTKISVNDTLMRLLSRGLLKHLVFLWLDCTLIVSNDVIKNIIDHCNLLNNFVVSYDCDGTLQSYIKQNNFDLKLDSNY